MSAKKGTPKATKAQKTKENHVKSRPSSSKSYAQELAELSMPAPKEFHPDIFDIDTAKIASGDFNNVQTELSNIKLNASVPQLDSKYHTKTVSRKELEQLSDQSDFDISDDFGEYEDENSDIQQKEEMQDEDEDEEDNEENREEEEEDDEEDEEDEEGVENFGLSDDEENSDHDEEIEKMLNEIKKKKTDEELIEDSDDNQYGSDYELREAIEAEEEEVKHKQKQKQKQSKKDIDNEHSEDISKEEMSEEEIITRTAEKAEELEQQLQKETANDENFQVMIKKDIHQEYEKAQQLKNQLQMIDILVDLRIRFQTPMNFASTLPQGQLYTQILEKSPECSEIVEKIRNEVSLIINKLKELENKLASYSEVKEVFGDSLKRKRSETEKPSLEELWREIKGIQERFSPYLDTLDTWSKRTLLGSYGALVTKGQTLNAFTVPIRTQIATAMNDISRTVKRTQLCRSGKHIIGKQNKQKSSQKETNDEFKDIEDSTQQMAKDMHLRDYDTEIYDDTDFYSTLLKDLIDSGVTKESSGSIEKEYEISAKQTKTKKKRIVDTKASKGRKLRYDVHAPLVNFCAPMDREPDWHAADQLFASLFGKK